MTQALRDGRDTCPVQRRVSYRRLRDNDDSGNESQDDINDSSHGLAVRHASSTSASPYLYDPDDGHEDEDILHATLISPRHSAWFIFLTTAVAALACFHAVIRHTSYERGTGAAETPSLPARHVPSGNEQEVMHDQRMKGATRINIGTTTVILQGGTAAAGKHGHMRLPDQFYHGLHLGLSGWDEWGVKLSDKDNKGRNAALWRTLGQLEPRPTAVYATTFAGGIEGFSVAFMAGDLSHQMGRDVHARNDPAWNAAEQAVLNTARSFQQLVMMRWYPKAWGPGHESDKHLHTSVLQEVRPTRTGLRKLSSTVAVYRVHKAVPVDDRGVSVSA